MGKKNIHEAITTATPVGVKTALFWNTFCSCIESATFMWEQDWHTYGHKKDILMDSSIIWEKLKSLYDKQQSEGEGYKAGEFNASKRVVWSF